MEKYYNPKTKKTEELFENLTPVYEVMYKNTDSGEGALYIIVEADDEEEAKNKAMSYKHFTECISMKDYNRKYLQAYKPQGLYVIGKVKFDEEDTRA